MASPPSLGLQQMHDREGVNPEQLFALAFAACFNSSIALVGRETGVDTTGSEVTTEVGIGMDDAVAYEAALAVTIRVALTSLPQCVGTV